MRLRPACLLLAALGLTGPASAQGESGAPAFEVALGGAVQVAEPYGGRWRARPGGVLRGTAPFYGGRAHVGLRAYPNDGEPAAALPDFLAVHAEAGWGPALALPAGLRLTAGAHLGAVAFRFSDAGAYAGALQNESELAMGLFARLDAPLAGRLRAWAGADAVRVFTAERTDLLFVEGGLALAVTAPDWLRRALR